MCRIISRLKNSAIGKKRRLAFLRRSLSHTCIITAFRHTFQLPSRDTRFLVSEQLPAAFSNPLLLRIQKALGDKSSRRKKNSPPSSLRSRLRFTFFLTFSFHACRVRLLSTRKSALSRFLSRETPSQGNTAHSLIPELLSSLLLISLNLDETEFCESEKNLSKNFPHLQKCIFARKYKDIFSCKLSVARN